MTKPKGRGQVLNHSSQELFVIETDSGKPIVHRLGPRRKSPSSVDADGFKRADGKAILLHKGWWKVPDEFKADIFEFSVLLIPVSVMVPDFTRTDPPISPGLTPLFLLELTP